MGIPEDYSKMKALKIIWEVEPWKEFWKPGVRKIVKIIRR